MKKIILTLILCVATVVSLAACSQKTGCEAGVHTFVNYEPSSQPTCISDGTVTAKCELCEATNTVEVKRTEGADYHKYENYVTVEATCYSDGKTVGTCVYCGAKDEKSINGGKRPAHNFGDVADYISDGEGTKYAYCQNEGCVSIDKIPDDSWSLAYELTEDGSGYYVSGILAAGTVKLKITIPETHEGINVVGIKEEAFKNASYLESVTIKAKSVVIGDRAFENCSSLTRVYTDGGVKSAGRDIFAGCDAMEFFQHEQGMYIGNMNNPYLVLIKTSDIFLEEFAINEKTQVIASEAFKDHTNLANLVVSDTLKNIGESAFENCLSLTEFDVPATLTTIGAKAFSGCEAIEKVNISNIQNWLRIVLADSQSNPISVSGAALYDNSKSAVVTELDFDLLGVTSINDFTFNNYVHLVSLNIPKTVTEVGEGNFAGCVKVETLSITADLIHLVPADSVVTLTVYGGNLIPENAFKDSAVLQKVVINGENTEIGAAAFAGCAALTDLTFSGTVSGVAQDSFLNSSAIANAKVPYIVLDVMVKTALVNLELTDGDQIVDEYFKDIVTLETVKLPDSVKSVGKAAFSGCAALKNIRIGSLVESVGDEAFLGCDALNFYDFGNCSYIGNDKDKFIVLVKVTDKNATEFTVNDSAKFIMDSAFKDASAFTEMVIPQSVIFIGKNAFENCAALKSLSLPSSFDLSYLSEGGNVFVGNNGIEEISVPLAILYSELANITRSSFVTVDINNSNGITDIADETFKGCDKLTKITLPIQIVKVGNSAFEGCAALAEVKIEQFETIGESAFRGCSVLPSFTFNSKLNVVSASAFDGCAAINKIALDNVTEIGDRAFAGTSVTEVVILSGATVGEDMFDGCSELVKVIIPGNAVSSVINNVKENLLYLEVTDGMTLAERALEGCAKLETVLIKTVTDFGTDCFLGCVSIKEITGDAALTAELNKVEGVKSKVQYVEITSGDSITAGAFNGYTALKKLMVCDSVNTISADALVGCSSLSEVSARACVIPALQDEAVKLALEKLIVTMNNDDVIGKEAFSNFGKLSYVKVISSEASAVSEIGESAFANCENLTTLEMASTENLKIGKKAFYNCDKLTEVSISASLIGEEAFVGCGSLVKVTISFAEEIADRAFSDCIKLAEISIPSSVEKIGSGVFYDCESLVYTEEGTLKYLGNADNEYLVLVYVGETEECTVNDKTALILSSSFDACASLKTLTVPKSVRFVGDKVFEVCKNLESVTADIDIVKSIFEGKGDLLKTTLKNVTFLDGEEIPDGFFKDYTALLNVVISESFKKICADAFNGCSAINTVVIPTSVENVGENAFAGCAIQKIELPAWLVADVIHHIKASVTTMTVNAGDTIESGAFKDCVELVSVSLDGITTIELGAFEGCSKLASIKLPATLVNVSAGTFEGCDLLTDITLPVSALAIIDDVRDVVVTVTVIADAATQNRATVNTAITDNAFAFCKNLETVTVGADITAIGYAAFFGCENLATVNLDENGVLDTIGASAFSGCSKLSEIVIPDSVKLIDNGAFYNCSVLEEVTFLGQTKPEIGSHVFFGCVYTLED